jgi:hypothetical protein
VLIEEADLDAINKKKKGGNILFVIRKIVRETRVNAVS